jgi:multidrug efflux pump subunit AcrB
MRQLRGNNEVEVRVKLPLEERKDIYNLEDFLIRTPDSTEVPLMDVVTVEQREAFTSINRRNGRRVVTVGMDAEPASAVTQVLASLNQEVLPQLRADFPGITWSYEGSQADMREATQTLWGGFTLAMMIIYALLAVAFNSYIQPLIVMAAIPFGIVGAVIGHILLGYDLSLVSLMGVIALSGVVVNDSLIMVDYANRRRADQSVLEAIHEAGIRRFRPIMLTTLTTFGGLTPIILLIVPCLYMILEDMVASVKKLKKSVVM